MNMSTVLSQSAIGTYTYTYGTQAGETVIPGETYVMTVIEGQHTMVPNDFADRILYIDDTVATSGTVTFTFALVRQTNATVLISGGDLPRPVIVAYIEGSCKVGDLDDDGEITDWDGILLQRYLAGWQVEINEQAADIDGEDGISDWDSILLERYLAGWNIDL